jgi:DNA repair protein RadC
MTEVLVAPTFSLRLTNGDVQPVDVDVLIDGALAALDARIQRDGKIESPSDAKAYFALRLGRADHEIFAVLFLDSQHRIIAYREMFHGTLTQTSVYPREIVRHALLLNAGAIMIAHNHPSSGEPTPSRADEHLTKAVVDAMRLVDVRVLDHFVVGAGSVVSFAEKGLI